MRNYACLTALAATLCACTGSPVNLGGTGGTTAGTTSGTTTGGIGGTTSTGTSTSTGGSSDLPNGAACTANAQCHSAMCGVNGTGNCCAAACPSGDAGCTATGCDATGACTYSSGTVCAVSCSGSTLTPGSCAADGSCTAATPVACPGNLVCNPAGTDCLTSCASKSDCVTGFYCNAGHCAAVETTGACSSNDACVSGICGVSGSGHCCTGPTPCSSVDVTCGAQDCDDTGACAYPSTAVTCMVTPLCTNGSQVGPNGTCNGMGSCSPATVVCAPFVCDTDNLCFTGCSDAGGCAAGAYCNTAAKACCPAGLGDGGTLRVDSVTGIDTPCCSLGTNAPCQTLTQAMALVNLTQAFNVTITATIDGGGGDWAPAGEVYPIELGWGVELSAPGVFFLDPDGGGSAILDVQVYAGDPLGYASVAGSASNQVGVGVNESHSRQTPDVAAISIEKGATLYLADALVNGSPTLATGYALFIAAGGALVLGQDQSATTTGTVNVGIDQGKSGNACYAGIYCETDGVSLGCTISDADLTGESSVVIRGQKTDLWAQDFAKITLTSAPTLGVAPDAAVFGTCPSLENTGVYITGPVKMTFKNGTVQCVNTSGFIFSASMNGGPKLTIDNSTIRNTSYALVAYSGAATVSNSTIAFNGVGAWQDSNGVDPDGTIDLSGGGIGGNAVICNNGTDNFTPGVDVFNANSQFFNAENVAWDTAGPDYFSCTDSTLASCTCLLSSCTNSPGGNDMDAVTLNVDAGILTSGATQSPLALDAGCQ